MSTLERLSDRLAGVSESATYAAMNKAAALRRAGHDVISLSAGEPDFETPENIKRAACLAIERGHTRYTPVAGIPELREAVVEKFRRENGLVYDTSETIVSTGGKQVLFNALAATLNPGDEVLIPTPYWVSYPEIALLCGARPVFVPTRMIEGFRIAEDALRRAITPRTRWLILNSPSNPSGAVYSRDDLAMIARVLEAHPQVLVLSDDIYEHLLYDGRRFATIAQLGPEMQARTLVVNGVSKAFAMTGWRIGYGAGPRWLIRAMETLQGQQTSGASSVSQHAALEALRGPRDFLRTAQESYTRRRDLVTTMLRDVPGLRCLPPEGAFYAFPSCAGLIGRRATNGRLLSTDEDVADQLLAETGVAAVHGSAFGLGPHLRIAFATQESLLIEACQRLSAFVSSLT